MSDQRDEAAAMAAYGTFAAGDSRSTRQKEPASDVVEVATDGANDGDVKDDKTCAMVDAHPLAAFYTSHGLFMWNNRSYEFASILFTAAAFPNTLVAASIRGLSAHLASVLLSPSVGRWCGRHASRLRPVQVCIVVQRASIVLACLGWMLIMGSKDTAGLVEGEVKTLVFLALVVLGMLERLSTVGNVIVVERDWLPLLADDGRNGYTAVPLADPDSTTTEVGTTVDVGPEIVEGRRKLHVLNATTKRIDLITKLVAPLAVSAIAIGVDSTQWAAVLLALSQVLSCGFELYLTTSVWRACPSLQKPKASTSTIFLAPESNGRSTPLWTSALQRTRSWVSRSSAYFGNRTCLASLAYAIEPFSVLTMAGSMSAYLLISHYPLSWITAARTASTAVEIASTILTPLLISWLSRRHHPAAQKVDNLRSLISVGLGGLSWQMLSLVPATVILFMSPGLFLTGSASHNTKMIVLFSSLAISRLGPFAYSLVEQQIVQLEVAEDQRLEFSGVEMALIDVAEMARWAMLGIFGNPGDFCWVALVSFGSVVLSVCLFACWVRGRKAVVSE